MTHQERVAKAANGYKDAKKKARLYAKAEAKAVYLRVYSQKKAEAYAVYSAALMQSASDEVVNIKSKSIVSPKIEYTINNLRSMSMDDILSTMEPEDEELHTDELT